MMKLFSQNILVQAVVIVAAMVMLWWNALATPQPMTASDGALLYGIVANWLAPLPLLGVILAMMLVLAEGVLLNILLVDHGLAPQNSMLPTLLYVVCASAAATTLTPMLLSAALLIACTQQLLLKGSLLTISTERACAATAFIGLASLFYLPSALMLVAYLLVAVNYRLYSWKDWSVLFLGFLAPYLLVATVLYMTDGLAQWFGSIVAAFADVHIRIGEFTTLQAVGNAVLILLLLAGVVSVWNISGERTVLWQKNAATMLAYLFGTVAMLFVTRLFTVDMQTAAVSFSFCVACLLMPPTRTAARKKRREWLPALLLVITIVAALLC